MKYKMLFPIVLLFFAPFADSREPSERKAATIRIATYNISFYRDQESHLARDLERGDKKAQQIAEVIQRVRPDVVLLNEFDYEANGRSLETFRTKYLSVSQQGCNPLEYAHVYYAPVNTGVQTKFDLDHDGRRGGPADAFGFGRYPGQYGMVVLSRFPIAREKVRTFQKFRWRDMPNAKLPMKPDTDESYYSEEELKIFRLSSKSFWDVPIEVPIGGTTQTLHLLCSHPTPPVFDGLENRNGLRNHDEIRLLADFLDPARSAYLIDDRGNQGGLRAGAVFVILGDLNADPMDGGAAPENIKQLLEHPFVNAKEIPASDGGEEASQVRADLNGEQEGDPRHDTADFSGDGHGNLRVDYVLPSRDLEVVSSGVFWPKHGEPGAEAIRATDHRLVWIDLACKPPAKRQAAE